jgi:hypothetical protein
VNPLSRGVESEREEDYQGEREDDEEDVSKEHVFFIIACQWVIA